jgi:archaellum component FlaC
MSREICLHCNSSFKNKSTLQTHINTNKKCLKLRGISLQTEFICEGCKTMNVALKHLISHREICKDYQKFVLEKKFKDEFEQYKKEQEKKYIEKVKEQETHFTDMLQKKNREIEDLKKSYDNISEQLLTLKEEYKNKTDKYEGILESLARDAVNKTTTTNTTNTVNNNMLREHLSTQYTMDALTDKQLEQRIRLCMTEQIFWEGQKGLAKMCVESIIKTPDNKMMICCTDTSRGKFKLFDVKGNLKEDIDARLFTDRVGKFIKIVGNEIREAIQDGIDNKSSMLEEKNGHEKDQLLKKMEQLGYSLFDVFNVDDHERNKVFRNELAALSSVKRCEDVD